jgi:hypothetical protein
MIADFEHRLKAIGRTMLTPLVRCALENETVDLLDWRIQPVTGGFSQESGEIYGVYRFQGTAQTQGESLSWSLILKATGAALTGSKEPSAWAYWKREVLVYQSGLLAELPGNLVAPRCFGVIEHPGEEFWIWLEDIVETGNGIWPLERYGQAARHLGCFNGVYIHRNKLPISSPAATSSDIAEVARNVSEGHLARRLLPAMPWLATSQLRPRLALAEPGIDELPRLRRHPLFAALLPGDSVERILHLWAQRERLLAFLDRCPQTLCHHDAFRRNLFSRRGENGQEKTVAIDWASAGLGVIGEDLAALFAVSLRFVEVDVSRIADLDAIIFAGYLAGLRDAGWQGDARLARFGFAATAALISGVADPATKLPRIARRVAALSPGEEPPRLLGPGPAQQAALQHHLLDMGEEALALLNSLA